jgi:LmbE family N-acetylglucosaminyl deacetylase
LIKAVAVIVAHPDDETLWAGGTILSHPAWNVYVMALCRASDQDRAPKFLQALKVLGADGIMGDLDDGPEQTPLPKDEVQAAILRLLPHTHFDLIISHHPHGEYTRHRRHEEIGSAAIALRREGTLSAHQLWMFAYEDGGKRYLPRAMKTADLYYNLPESIWQRKYQIITATYGFETQSWEAGTTPRAEAFWHSMQSHDVRGSGFSMEELHDENSGLI